MMPLLWWVVFFLSGALVLMSVSILHFSMEGVEENLMSSNLRSFSKSSLIK